MSSGDDLLNRVQTRTWATVRLDAVAHNVRVLRGCVPSRTAFMAVVKADAYGHGAVPVARAAIGAGASWLGVATPDEALALRAAGIDARVLVLGPVAPAFVRDVVAAGCALTVADPASLEAAHQAGGATPVRVHLKVDTGMARLGVAPEDVGALLPRIDGARVIVEGVFTHLACADDHDPTITRAQLAAFGRAADAVARRFPGVIRHAAASAAVVGHREAALDLVRVGISLYGIPAAPHLRQVDLRPVMTLASRVVRLRRVARDTPVSYGATYRTPADTVIATVPVGYADGYPRALGNRGVMLVRGQRVPVAGRVCMDYTMLDTGGVALAEGDEVEVFGDGLPVWEVADTAGTIAYELLCRIGPRVPRVYTRDGRAVAVTLGTLRDIDASTAARAAGSR
ncbi:MAG: alanine racemase [Armatimonadota bacterium]|nr:alanine racemase [Armatimonadota bacterium]